MTPPGSNRGETKDIEGVGMLKVVRRRRCTGPGIEHAPSDLRLAAPVERMLTPNCWRGCDQFRELCVQNDLPFDWSDGDRCHRRFTGPSALGWSDRLGLTRR
jgi:hypothetical protein